MRDRSRRFVLSALLLGVCLLARPPLAAQAADAPLTVFAAASLKNALDDAVAAFRSQTGLDVKVNYAGSSALAKQIEQGAPADLFASADVDWMDYAEKHDLIRPGTRVSLLGNALVVIAPTNSPVNDLALTPAAFDAAVGAGRWATGTVTAVPVGIYAKASLTKLGLWPIAAAKLAETPDVRTATAFVARGEAALGIVYRTDANAEPKVKVVAELPDDSHAPIVYPFALTKAARGEAPARFLAFLTGPDARPFFERQGFRVLRP